MAKETKKTKEEKKEETTYVYGEMNSMEEINAKANELKAAGDKDGVLELAKENGIDKDLADMYMQGYTVQLCPDLMTAAAGKLDVEISRLETKNSEVGAGIADYLKQKAMEDDEIAIAIRKKGKSLKEICDKAWSEANKRRKGNCAYIPPFEVFQMARAYYLED